MAKVLLRDGWFAPNGVFYRKCVTKKGPPVDVPDNVIYDAEGRSRLPSTAEIVASDYVTPEPKRVSADTFSEHRAAVDAYDQERAAMASQGRAVAEADQTLAENAARHQAELAAENEVLQPPKRGPGRPRKGKTDA